MGSRPVDFDLIVLGDHPCTYVAAILARSRGLGRVLHAVIPTDVPPNRAVLVNPAVFSLDPSLVGWREGVDLTPVHGLTFLGDDASTRGEHVSPSPIAFCARIHDLAAGARAIAKRSGVTLATPTSLVLNRPEPDGAAVVIDGVPTRATALIVGGDLPLRDKRSLGIPEGWDEGVTRRLCHVELPHRRAKASPTVVPMSLDLGGSLCWAWMLSTADARHLVVDQPMGTPDGDSTAALHRWAGVLGAHGMLDGISFDANHVVSVVAPITGALAHDGVADRTLLIGPAGGFYSACSEDIYPNCWSAVHAIDTLVEAVKQPLLQDALDAYRSCWRTTLGIYLQGHQQNLRFLLPMIYRNPAMTSRLAEAIMVGKSVVR